LVPVAQGAEAVRPQPRAKGTGARVGVAQAVAGVERRDVAAMSTAEIRHLLQELNRRQIALERQNEALTQARDHYSDLYESAPVGYLTLDVKGKIREANRAAVKMLGTARQRLTSKAFTGFVSAESQDVLYRHLRAASDSSATQSCELKMRGVGDAPLWVSMTTIALGGADRQPGRFWSALEDVSARKRAEDALQEREREIRELNASLAQRVHQRTEQLVEQRARLQAVVDIAGEGIITIDEAGIVESINNTGLKIFGYCAEEVLGRNVNMLMPSPDRDAHDGYIRRYIKTKRPTLLGTIRTVSARRKDGSIFPVEISIGEMVLSGVRLFVARLRDITQRRQLEVQARERLEDAAQLQRLGVVGELAGVLAHQLNQPLAAILSFAEAGAVRVRRGGLSAEQLLSVFNDIAAQAQRAAETIRDLRTFLSRDAGDSIACDINTIATWVCEMFDVLAKDANVDLQLELGEQLPQVMVRKAQIEQVLTNLLDNAIDAIVETAPGPATEFHLRGEIAVRTALGSGGRSVVVSVQDSGQGLDEATARQVFEPLYTSKKDGIGLGLAIAQSIVSAHGGRIWAEPGPAGVFRFELPIGQSEQ
jgi:two-component system sensor kinase FixL